MVITCQALLQGKHNSKSLAIKCSSPAAWINKKQIKNDFNFTDDLAQRICVEPRPRKQHRSLCYFTLINVQLILLARVIGIPAVIEVHLKIDSNNLSSVETVKVWKKKGFSDLMILESGRVKMSSRNRINETLRTISSFAKFKTPLKRKL